MFPSDGADLSLDHFHAFQEFLSEGINCYGEHKGNCSQREDIPGTSLLFSARRTLYVQ